MDFITTVAVIVKLRRTQIILLSVAPCLYVLQCL